MLFQILKRSCSTISHQVDDEAPSAGVVWDGQDLHDLEYQNHTTSISASWHGFSDLQSFIRRYVWCVGTRPGQADILACKSVGIRTSVSSTVTLKAGMKGILFEVQFKSSSSVTGLKVDLREISLFKQA